MSWIEEMEMFVTAEEPALGDVETLQAQLLESIVCLGFHLHHPSKTPSFKLCLLLKCS